MRRPLRVQRGDQLQAVQGLYPVEQGGRLAALVRLQVADEMPLQAESGQCADLGRGFLHVVLAEGALAGAGQPRHRVRRLRLRYRQQPRLWPVGLPGRVFDRLLERGQGIGRLIHLAIVDFDGSAILPPEGCARLFQAAPSRAIGRGPWTSRNCWHSR